MFEFTANSVNVSHRYRMMTVEIDADAEEIFKEIKSELSIEDRLEGISLEAILDCWSIDDVLDNLDERDVREYYASLSDQGTLPLWRTKDE